MAIVGAFLGGPGTTIPVGSGIMELQWVTSDGQNQTISYQIAGPETKTLQSDSNGYVAEMVTAGTYTVTPIHDGEYSGDDAKTVTVPNRSSVSATWFANRLYQQTVVFQSPGSIPGASYVIKNSKGEVQGSGTGWQSSMTFNLYPGDYTLELSFAGVSITKSVSFDSSATVDCSDLMCKVTISSSYGVAPTVATYNGTSVSITGNAFFLIRTSVSKTISFPGSPGNYGGVSTSPIGNWDDVQFIADAASKTVTVSVTPTTVLITRSGSLSIPVKGTYNVAVIGGGGVGGQYDSYWGMAGYGGCGGEVAISDLSLSKTSYELTIGAGGANSPYVRAGATSFGSLLSASGGDSGGNGSEGGTGGGASGFGTSYGQSSHGTNANFAGGGGARTTTYLGTAGTYGGIGGTTTSNAGNGRSASSRKDVFKNNNSYSGGGIAGGGGGLGAKGGRGDEYAGGGGGGINGGDGGDAGSASTQQGGLGGKGYGAGGGGAGEEYNIRRGGGGGGGYGATRIAGTGSSSGGYGGDGAQGCILIMWRGY